MKRVGLVLLGMIILSSAAYAEIYKWVDANGKVYYSDKQSNNSAKKISIKEGSPTNASESLSAEERLAKQKKYLDYRQSEREEKKKLKETREQEKAKHNRYCIALQDELNSLTQEYAIWYDLDEDTGERHYLTDDELEQRIEDLRNDIQSDCS